MHFAEFTVWCVELCIQKAPPPLCNCTQDTIATVWGILLWIALFARLSTDKTWFKSMSLTVNNVLGLEGFQHETHCCFAFGPPLSAAYFCIFKKIPAKRNSHVKAVIRRLFIRSGGSKQQQQCCEVTCLWKCSLFSACKNKKQSRDTVGATSLW